MKRRRWILSVLLLLVAGAVSVLLHYGPRLGIYLVPPSPKVYLRQAVGLMDSNGIYAQTAEWAAMREHTLAKGKDIGSYEEAHRLIDEALKVAGGKHSRLITAESQQEEGYPVQLMPDASIDDQGIMTLVIPMILQDAQLGQLYAEAGCGALREHRDRIRGVIVDLRGNTGGDMGPMVAALSPLLPDGELMSFDIRGRRAVVTLRGGTVTGGGSTVTVADPFKLEGVPVALLQDGHTGSSGEATLLTFRGLDNVRSFGLPSAGYCSSNMVYRLFDGAQMLLTVGADVARTGERFCELPIDPDTMTPDADTEARKWISVRLGER